MEIIDISSNFARTEAPASERGYDVSSAMSSGEKREASIEAQMLGHADALYNLAAHLTSRPGDAEDLVQETFIRALRAAPRLGHEPNVKAWLFKILRNAFYDLHRSEKTRRTVELGDEEEWPAPDRWLRGDADLDRLRGLVARDIELAMAKLAEPSRTAVLLDLEGFTEAEIADVMDCPLGTVKSRLMRARTNLRKLLSQYAT